MGSRAPDPSSSGAKEADAVEGLAEELARLKQQILESRAASIKEKLVKNNKLVVTISEELICASSSRDGAVDHGESNNMLTVRKRSSLYTLSGSEMGVGEKDSINAQEEVSSSSIIFGSSNGGKCTVHVIKLPRVETIPRYATWIYLNRNQRMADDQSVLGRRQIYYDQDKHGSETLICSDSEGELIEPEEERFNFSDGQDQLLWKALHDYGTNPEVLHVLRQFIDASTSEIEERYEILLKRQQMDDNTCSRASSENGSEIFIDKSHKTLASAMDSYDNLFCRRCLVFDCRTHGCSQNLIFPSEKLPFSTEPEERGKPCSNECYLHLCLIRGSCSSKLESGKQPVLGEGRSDDEQCKSGLTSTIDLHDGISATLLASKRKRKTFDQEHESFDKEDIGINGGMLLGTDKKQSNLLNTNVTIDSANLERMNADLPKKAEYSKSKSQCGYPMQENASKSLTGSELNTSIGFGDVNTQNALKVEVRSLDGSLGDTGISDHFGRHYPKTWNPFEKDLYLKGVEIFGKNSCLIARNLLSGMKTCMEVADYMYNNGINMSNRSPQDKSVNVAAVFHYMEQEIPARTRILRRRGRARKLKYTWKSAGYSSVRKRIADGKERCKQYVPCECQLMCSKQCPCVENANCCEKYCGCSKSCKNRFRGCHCAKSQCRSRQCPCFAAGRECDPDVCRNCWVSCGDQLLGSPPARGDGYQCGNMKLLLKQQQRILLGRSDVAGWGVFIKNPVNKNDYLGEYTGELISHKEADKRGKVYDRANSSFLFDLNDEFVLDACRKGDKLKFANHSSNPNCYAKIMLVAGDHRVGIFANEHIDPGEELFYDYRYGPDEAPPWARKPEGSKKDDPSASQSRRISKAA